MKEEQISYKYKRNEDIQMIITKTPFRMSFFGGGTDMPSFFQENGGAVLSTTFDKYCYVNVRHLPRFFDYSTELSYSKTERVTDVEDIQHPAIRNAMKFLDMHEIRLTYEADLPARSGLGTSSSFAVGMLNAFYALKGKYADKKKLADEAIYLERELCMEAGGWQDQIAASFGGFNRINFTDEGYEVLPIIISPERKKQLNQNLMMFFTGFTRFSSDVQKANAAGKVDKTAQLKEMLSLVDEAEKVLTDKSEAIKKANESGYLTIVVTNQPVIARGEVSFEELEKIHNKMETLLGKDGAYIDGLYYCPHHPHKGYEGERPELKIECECRKPKPGMLIKAAEDFNIDLEKSWMVGDGENDVLAGKKAGCKTVLIGSQDYQQDYTVSSLKEFVDKML